MLLSHWSELGPVATLSSKGGWEMDAGRQLGVLATETAGGWLLHLETDHTADEPGSSPALVMGAGTRGWPSTAWESQGESPVGKAPWSGEPWRWQYAQPDILPSFVPKKPGPSGDSLSVHLPISHPSPAESSSQAIRSSFSDPHTAALN